MKEDLTKLLNDYQGADRVTVEKILPLVYNELRKLAYAQMRREGSNHTLQPTALVHEAFFKLQLQKMEWQNRGHFMSLAARIMRRVLVDHARAKNAEKRGGDRTQVAFEEGWYADTQDHKAEIDVVLLHEALTKFETLDPYLSKLVELRFFAGLSLEETAEALEKSVATVKRDWAKARAWLSIELETSGV